jgi:segregation and condensation protein B
MDETKTDKPEEESGAEGAAQAETREGSGEAAGGEDVRKDAPQPSSASDREADPTKDPNEASGGSDSPQAGPAAESAAQEVAAENSEEAREEASRESSPNVASAIAADMDAEPDLETVKTFHDVKPETMSQLAADEAVNQMDEGNLAMAAGSQQAAAEASLVTPVLEEGAEAAVPEVEAAVEAEAADEARPADGTSGELEEAAAAQSGTVTGEPEVEAQEGFQDSTQGPAMDADELLGTAAAEPEAGESSDAETMAILEAIVYVTDEPLSAPQIAHALGKPVPYVQSLLDNLVAEYEKPSHGLSIKEVAGGYKMATKAEHHEAVRAFVKNLNPPMKLSLAALETLAVIAYKQPLTAPEIMEIRGVQGAGVLKTLLDRKLITTAGRKNVIGKPILYKTTKEFLVQFGLKDLNELPSLKEFEEIRRMALDDGPTTPEPDAPGAPVEEPGEGDAPEGDPPSPESPVGDPPSEDAPAPNPDEGK